MNYDLHYLLLISDTTSFALRISHALLKTECKTVVTEITTVLHSVTYEKEPNQNWKLS